MPTLTDSGAEAGHLLRSTFAGASLERDLRAFCRQAPPGQAILPERQLAEKYGISHSTVRRVMDVMLTDNLIHKVQGKGTFVGPAPDTRRLGTVVLADTWHNLDHTFYASRMRGILRGADELSFRLEILRCDPQLRQRQRLLEDVARTEVSGLIVPWATLDLLARVREVNPRVRMVTTASSCPPLGVSAVGVDYPAIGSGAVQYLVDQGCRRPVLATMHPEARPGIDERSAYHRIECRCVRLPPIAELDPFAAAGELRAAAGDGLAFDDDQAASRILAALGRPAVPVISHDNLGSTDLPPYVARLEIDGEQAGLLVMQVLRGMVAGELLDNTTILIRPTLKPPLEVLPHDPP